MNSEAIIAANPDFILMMNGRSSHAGGDEGVLSRPDIALTTAGQNDALIEMDGMLLLGFGIRTPQVVRELGRYLHPEQAAERGCE